MPTTANAVTFVDASAKDVTVRYNDCKTTPVDVSGDWHTDYSNEIRIVVRKPSGRRFDSRTFYDDFDGAVRMNVRLCDGDRAGRYTVAVTAIGYDEFYEETSREEASTGFKYTYIPKANSRLRHRVHHNPNAARWKYDVPGQLLRKGHGFKGERVLLVVRIAGDWYRADAQRTRRRGYFGWRFEPNGLRWRYFYRGDRRTKPSVTDVFRTPRRTSARVSTSSTEEPVTLEQAQALIRRS